MQVSAPVDAVFTAEAPAAAATQTSAKLLTLCKVDHIAWSVFREIHHDSVVVILRYIIRWDDTANKMRLVSTS